jgi:hypothetical protein
MMVHALALSLLTMPFLQSRLVERKLADIGVIGVPRGIKDETHTGARDAQIGRLTFTFSTTYFWASFGSGPAYKQKLWVSVMAPDASAAEYDEFPKWFDLTYDDRKTVRTAQVGSGRLTVSEGIYRQNALAEPSYTFFYVDRARRLQLLWHAVKGEVDLDAGVDAIGRMAASFRIIRDPAAQFAEMRDRPRKDAEERKSRRAMAIEMLAREGYGTLEPGKPVLRNGVYVEWMSDPEPRFQLLLPLGRVAVSPDVSPAMRPRPITLSAAAHTNTPWPGSIGWREYVDEEWQLSNNENAYLPFPGVAAALGAAGQDRGFVYFYYAATVRVEEEPDDTRLTNLRWFFEGLPEAKRLWREGKLVTGGRPAPSSDTSSL